MAVLALVATGCTTQTGLSELPSEPTQSSNANASPSNQADTDRIFIEGCQRFNDGELSHKYLELYRPIVQDICVDFEMRYDLVEVYASPLVKKSSVELYVANNVFGLSYWDKYVAGGLKPLKLIVLTEDDQDWWAGQLDDLLTIEPEWFGPTDGGGHCFAAVASAFCPKSYFSFEGDTTGDFDVLTTMLGSRLEWDTFRKVVPIHESTHAFQAAGGLGHWRYWFVEGQATYFELAASILVPELGSENWRDELAANAPSRDELQFNATTTDEVNEYMAKCNGEFNCDGFRYFGASLAHELLVNTFGMEKYFAWNVALAKELPDFNWRGMTEKVTEEGQSGFARLFEEYFDVDIQEWERTQLASYILANY